MSDYKSPIKMTYSDISYADVFGIDSIEQFTKKVANDTDDMIFDILKTEIKQNIGLDIDFDELKKALEYDRHQYEQGFNDGKIARDNEIIRCKDCIHYNPKTYSCKVRENDYMEPDDFCSYAEDTSILEDI